MPFSDIAAVIFDMDGTLVDSEVLTEPTVRAALLAHGIEPPPIDYTCYFGVSFGNIAHDLRARLPQLARQRGLAARLHDIYHEMLESQPPPLIRAARRFVIDAHGRVPTAIVSSSGRRSIRQTMTRMGILGHIDFYAGAEDYPRSKPAPDGFLAASAALGVEPARCLVFEDSIPGLQAARGAGMRVVAVTHRSADPAQARRLAEHSIVDFAELDGEFLSRIAPHRRSDVY